MAARRPAPLAAGQPLARDGAERAAAGCRDAARDERAPVHECLRFSVAACAAGARGGDEDAQPATAPERVERLDLALGRLVARVDFAALPGRSTPRGRRAPPRAPSARPRPRSISFSRLAGAARWFFDGPAAGFGAGSASAAPASPPWRLGRLALLAHAQVLGPAADVGAQRVVLDRDGARADGVEQRAVVGDQQQRALEALERGLERLAALEVEVVGRLVEDQDVGAGVRRGSPATAAAARRPRARRPASRPPRRRTGTGRAARAPRSARARSRAGPASSTVRGRVRAPRRAGRAAPSLTLCPRRSLPPSSSRAPASALISVVLPDAVGRRPARRARRARATARRRAAARARRSAASPSSISKMTRPERSGGLKRSRARLPSRGSRVTRSILSSFFARDCAWRARVPARKRSTKRSSRSISASCCSIARPSASSRAAFSLRQACQVPLKKRARPASSSSTAVPTASRNQRSWATSTTAASSVCRCPSSHSSDSMSRWLVGSSSSSRSGSPASARASDARVSSPPENVGASGRGARRGSRGRAASR